VPWSAQGHRTNPLARERAARGAEDAKAFAAFLAPLRRKRWFVYTKRPFAGPKAVLAYAHTFLRLCSPSGVGMRRYCRRRWPPGR
jgi:hypothetical protein